MARTRYHHGDLRAALLREATSMLREEGLEGLSMRRLAERIGVTAPAVYHHFRDKNDLLCALAQQGFVELERRTSEGTASTSDTVVEPRVFLAAFVRAYVGFAAEQPEIYDLMFGRAIWKAGAPTDTLREVAYGTFRRYVRTTRAMPGMDELRGRRSLRLAQVSWATLHGLCRLLNDGIYVDRADLDAMSDQAVELLLAGLDRARPRPSPTGGPRSVASTPRR